MLNQSSSSPTLTNVTFSGNSASGSVGRCIAIARRWGISSPTLTNVTFSGNSATIGGGGMYIHAENYGTSSPTLTNVTFSGNRANYGGGGMFNLNQQPDADQRHLQRQHRLQQAGRCISGLGTSSPTRPSFQRQPVQLRRGDV